MVKKVLDLALPEFHWHQERIQVFFGGLKLVKFWDPRYESNKKLRIKIRYESEYLGSLPGPFKGPVQVRDLEA